MKLDLFDSFLMLQPHQKRTFSLLKLKSTPQKNLGFEPTRQISSTQQETLNFGQNKPLEEIKKIDPHDHLMTPEMQSVVVAMDLKKDHAQIKYLSSQN